MRAIYPGPSVPAHMRDQATTHPVLGEIKPGILEWPDHLTGEVRAAIVAGLLAPEGGEAPAAKASKSKKASNPAEPAEAAASQKE